MTEGVVVKKFSCDDLPKRCFTSFDELRSEKQLCDFTFNVGEVSIAAHRVILAAAIPYYRNMFLKGIDEVPDIEPTTLECLINYAYTHEVSIDTNNVKSLLGAAGQLGIDEVKQACCDFLSGGLEPKPVSNDQDLSSSFDSLMRLEDTDCNVRDNVNVISETGNSLNNPVTNLKDSVDKDDPYVKEEVLDDVSSLMNDSVGKDDPNVEKALGDVARLVKEALDYPNVKKEVLDDGLCLAQDSLEDRKNVLPESQSETRMLLDEPPHLELVKNAYLSPKREQVCSGIIEPKRKGKCTSYEQILNPCMYKLNVKQIYTVQYFNLFQEEWITKSPEAYFTYSGSTVPLQNKTYFFRFSTTLQYDPITNSFKSMSCIPTVRDFLGATALKNRIYVCGGRVGNSEATNAVECFYPATNAWQKVESMATCRLGLNAVTLNNCIFAIGGRCKDLVYSSVEKYDPLQDTWTFIPAMLDKRCAAGAAALNDSIYVCGGIPSNDVAVASCEVYSPTVNEWMYISPLNSARCFFILLSFKQKLYAIGGWKNEDVHVFDVYDPQSNTWRLGPSTDGDFLTSDAFVVPVVDG